MTSLIILQISQSQADEFLDHALPLLDTAADYAQQCAEILVTEYGAKREDILGEIFRDPAISRLANGQPLDDPHLAVRKAVQTYRPNVLGL